MTGERVEAKKLNLTRSYELLARAQELIPGVSQTFSKAPSQIVQGVSPIFLQRGKGAHVWDVDGNRFIDYPTSLGPIVLGHDDPDVTEAVVKQVSQGTIFSLSHPIELEVAERIVDAIPCAEMVRFGKNGSDATSASVRVSRAYTGRDVVATYGYHGWQDWYIGTTTRNAGVPKAVTSLTATFSYNDIGSLEKVFAENPGNVACVIMEPVGVVEPEAGFLQSVAALCKKNGTVLIFDEVLTGFRIAYGGAQERYGVTPDLACFAKAVANGYPLSVVTGRRDIMELFDEIFFSFTFGGETVSLAAAKATMDKMQREPVIDHLWKQGRKIQDGYNSLAAEFGIDDVTSCIGLPPRTVCTFSNTDTGEDDLLLRSILQQELIQRGILFLFGFNTSYALSDDDVSLTLDALRDAMPVLSMAKNSADPGKYLKGTSVQPVFRRA